MCQTRADRLQLAPGTCRCTSRDQIGSYTWNWPPRVAHTGSMWMTSLYQTLQRHAGCQFCNLNLTTLALGLLQTIWFLTLKSARRWLCVFVESWTIDTKALESVDAHKVLGVTIQGNLKWDLHINEVVAKVSKRLHIQRVLKRGGVPPADLLTLFCAH